MLGGGGGGGRVLRSNSVPVSGFGVGFESGAGLDPGTEDEGTEATGMEIGLAEEAGTEVTGLR
jgi:hypothetical protein